FERGFDHRSSAAMHRTARFWSAPVLWRFHFGRPHGDEQAASKAKAPEDWRTPRHCCAQGRSRRATGASIGFGHWDLRLVAQDDRVTVLSNSSSSGLGAWPIKQTTWPLTRRAAN